ncbi:MAG: glycosyltransferase [Nitrospirae bacterium]|nr:glycosyltransferase [Nitrospirota bacterium]
MEYSYLGQYIRFFSKRGIPTVYASHNAQAYLDYLWWKTEGGVARKIVTLPVILLNYLHERLFFPEADRFLCISEIDMEYYGSFVSSRKMGLLPNFYIETDIEGVEGFSPPHEYICMVGSMNSFQNYEGALFLLRDIWPLIKARHAGLHLYLVGKLPPQDSYRYRELRRLADGLPRVVLTGEVDDAIPYVKGALATLVPVMHGSGTRTKIIESAACRTPVVSTSVGAEGLPFSDGESIMIADDPVMFAEKTGELLSSGDLRARIAAEAFDVFRKDLGYEVNKNRIEQIVEDLAGAGSR